MFSNISRFSFNRIVSIGPNSGNYALNYLLNGHRISCSQYANKFSVTIISVSLAKNLYATAARSRSKTKTTKKSKTKSKTKSKKKPKSKSTARPKRKTVKASRGKKIVKAKKKPLKKKTLKKKPLKKKAIKKPKKVKKVLTEAQKSKLIDKKLKEKALELPKKLPETPYIHFISENLRGASKDDIVGKMQGLGAEWRNLSESEREPFRKKAENSKATNAKTLQNWINQHTPDEIRIANNARKQLRRRSKKYWPLISDPRIPKRPLTPMVCYLMQRYSSEEYDKSSGVTKNMKQIAAEFKDLSPAQRKKFDDMALQRRQLYLKQFRDAFQRESSVKQDREV